MNAADSVAIVATVINLALVTVLAGATIFYAHQTRRTVDELRESRRAQDERDRRVEAGIRRALVAEIRENIRRLGGLESTEAPSIALVRTAWDQARTIELPDGVFTALAEAYASAAQAQEITGFLLQRAPVSGLVWSKTAHAEKVRTAMALAHGPALAAKSRFQDALAILGERPEPEQSRN